ncbi:sensor histidine kinase [Variovorax sp. RT4R15]|uniref:sensor histidine kinase n=1 Tax=Variovorax sp. RT4R15 TaxID=3443737 RepID=UPI003F47512C
MNISQWLPAVLVLLLALLAIGSFLALRRANQSLRRLANAAQSWRPDLESTASPVRGSQEARRAHAAFIEMQNRIAGCLAERNRVLATIAHDLQTPISRMRLRAEMMGDQEQRGKLVDDLEQMVALVSEALTYARTLHGIKESPRRIDLDALLDSLRCDYQDAGHTVNVVGQVGRPVGVLPLALRRIVTNLADNALKFDNVVELTVQVDRQADIEICVLDRGPGIPESELDAVMQPFYRLEGPARQSAAGTGLGLAIAKQLASSMGARLKLSNRPGGGLAASLSMPLHG